jgi:hypothetical protein
MEYAIKIQESELTKTNYEYKGKTHCAVFVQGVTGLPGTSMWKKGRHVMSAPAGTIPKGTAIATFDDAGSYPTIDCPRSMKDYTGGTCGRHAAIYVSHDATGINVYDQWAGSGGVKPRKIHAKDKANKKRVNEADYYYTVEV